VKDNQKALANLLVVLQYLVILIYLENMISRHLKLSSSQVLATLGLGGAVCLMLAPLGAVSDQRRHDASILPLLAAGTLPERAGFQSLGFQERIGTSKILLYRSAAEARRKPQRREIVVKKRTDVPPVDFRAPRVEWRMLGAGERRKLDQVISRVASGEAILRSSGTTQGHPGTLNRVRQRLGWTETHQEPQLWIGNGRGLADGKVWIDPDQVEDTVNSSFVLGLVGDYHLEPPSQAQFEALAEVLDYVEMRSGRITLRVSSGSDGRELGGHFPLWQLARRSGLTR